MDGKMVSPWEARRFEYSSRTSQASMICGTDGRAAFSVAALLSLSRISQNSDGDLKFSYFSTRAVDPVQSLGNEGSCTDTKVCIEGIWLCPVCNLGLVDSAANLSVLINLDRGLLPRVLALVGNERTHDADSSSFSVSFLSWSVMS